MTSYDTFFAWVIGTLAGVIVGALIAFALTACAVEPIAPDAERRPLKTRGVQMSCPASNQRLNCTFTNGYLTRCVCT